MQLFFVASICTVLLFETASAFTSWSLPVNAGAQSKLECNAGEAVNGIIIQPPKPAGSSAAASPGVAQDLGNDYQVRIFCSTTSNATVATAQQQQPRQVRVCKEFTLAEGVKMDDPEKNCQQDEFCCGLLVGGSADRKTMQWQCCKDSKVRRSDKCHKVGPQKLSYQNPNQILNPSKPQVGCALQAAVAVAFSSEGATAVYCELPENGKQYPASCEEKKEQDIQENNQKVADEKHRNSETHTKSETVPVSGPGAAASSSRNTKTQTSGKSSHENSGDTSAAPSSTIARSTGYTPSTSPSVSTTSSPSTPATASSGTPRHSGSTPAPTGSTRSHGKSNGKSGEHKSGERKSGDRKRLLPSQSIVPAPVNPHLPPPPPNPVVPPVHFPAKHSRDRMVQNSATTISTTSTVPPTTPPQDNEPCVCLCNVVCTKSGSRSSQSSQRTQHSQNNGNGQHTHGSQEKHHGNNGNHFGLFKHNKRSAEKTRTTTTETSSSTLQVNATTYQGKDVYIIDNNNKMKQCPSSRCNCPCVCN